MRAELDKEMESGRILFGHYGTPPNAGPFGAFKVICPLTGGKLHILATDGDIEDAQGWDHVSVSLSDRCPTWEEMHWTKQQFWLPEECVFQLHPPESEYINFHPYALHMWRHTAIPCPKPPSIFVGPAKKG
jgi:hypothetical protein